MEKERVKSPKTIKGKEITVTVVEHKNGFADVDIETPRMFVTMWIKTRDRIDVTPYDMILVQSKAKVSALEMQHFSKITKIKPLKHGVASITVRVRQNEKGRVDEDWEKRTG